MRAPRKRLDQGRRTKIEHQHAPFPQALRLAGDVGISV
jgi:hypothetical protein